MRTNTSEDTGCDRDVVIVGGGPAGCSAGVFAARYGLDTVIFDRGRSSIQRCAYLENYLGFPAGIDIETFYGLIHDHAEEAGCEIVADLVDAIDRRPGDREGFVVEAQGGQPVTTRCVVAAARYDADYLRPLDDGGAMFETRSHGDEEHEYFDRGYPEPDGTTPIEGLYVAAPTRDAEAQAITSAGRGARVARTLLRDVRRGRGYPEAMARHWDWVRRDAELSGEWAARDWWREHAEAKRPDDHRVSDERWSALREREIDRRFETYLTGEEIERRIERGHERLLEHIDDDRILEAARHIEAKRAPSEVTEEP